MSTFGPLPPESAPLPHILFWKFFHYERRKRFELRSINSFQNVSKSVIRICNLNVRNRNYSVRIRTPKDWSSLPISNSRLSGTEFRRKNLLLPERSDCVPLLKAE